MSSEIQKQREAVLKIGRGPDWPTKVAKMSEAQITAIYIRLKSQGKL